ncbi:hypothetical protein, partial [Cupriavidus lacunae]|uniref:hypothetical protein n=1 Tax=Cupriavidus lacunae TaxID=2666307 RepID=UPI0013750CA3
MLMATQCLSFRAGHVRLVDRDQHAHRHFPDGTHQIDAAERRTVNANILGGEPVNRRSQIHCIAARQASSQLLRFTKNMTTDSGLARFISNGLIGDTRRVEEAVRRCNEEAL